VKLTIRSATPEMFAELRTWRYEPPYDFYDGDAEPVRNPERWYEALDEAGVLIGNFYFEQKGDALEVGLGLRPDLTGRGLGLDFLLAGIDFGRRRFGLSRVILNVAAFNERAIKVYERAGFRETGRHTRRFDRWGEVEFVDMEQAAERG